MKMPQEFNKTLNNNQDKKSKKITFFNYAATESLLQEIQTCDKNLEILLTSKTNKHAGCSHSIFPHCSFNRKKVNMISVEVKAV